MIDVNSCLPEFGYELLSAVPYAKWLSENGLLGKTVSGRDTKALYWWSENHIEIDQPRRWKNYQRAERRGLPNIRIHTPNYDFSKWSNPGWVDCYKNDVFVFDKPLLCICNRINVEWERAVINYFDLGVLSQLFAMLKPYYQIVYFNIDGRPELYDGVVPVSIGDYDFIRKHHPEVKIVHDLHAEHKKYTFNELQLMLFANSRAFITMNGGHGIMASFFKGTNIIYSRQCRELGQNVNSFRRWYPKLGGQRVVVANSYEELLKQCQVHFVKKVPAFNVLMRTSERPDAFRLAFSSLMSQTYENVNIIVSVDEPQGVNYTIGYPCLVERVERLKRNDPSEFPFNLYFNRLAEFLQPGYVIHFDDDDLLADEMVLETIAKKIEETKSEMLCFKVSIDGQILPKVNYGKYPVRRDFTGGSFAVRSEKWQPWKNMHAGDWDVSKRLYDTCKVSWVPNVFMLARAALSQIQSSCKKAQLPEFMTEINYHPVTMEPIRSQKRIGGR